MAVAILVVSAGVSADEADPWHKFYQFRHSSALPGNLFGVTADGQIGFDGALQQNVPVAYTPSAGNWVLGGNSGSNDSGIHLKWRGGEVNGTAFLGVGLGKPGRGIYLSEMATGDDYAPAQNVQVQLMGETFEHPAVAVGIQDIQDNRQRAVGTPHGARSVYVVVTGRIGQGDRPSHVSLGWGGGRFGSTAFGGISVPISTQATFVGEYDGLNTNAGLAYSLVSAPERQPWGAVAYLGWSDLERPMIGFTITRRNVLAEY